MESEEEEEYSSFSYQIRNSFNEFNLNNELSRKSIASEKWFKELDSHNINKDKLNRIIANYLFIQGYCLPLKTFIQETNIKFDFNEELLNKRFQIRQLITNNQIEKVIEEINLIDKKILQENKMINFVLHRQILLNYIKENKLQEGLTFAKETLLPLTEGDDFLYKEFERIMCLFVYDDINESPEREYMTDKFLEKIASKMNLVLLNYMCGNKMINLNLELLIKLVMYVQSQLKKEMDFPLISSLFPLTFSNANSLLFILKKGN